MDYTNIFRRFDLQLFADGGAGAGGSGTGGQTGVTAAAAVPQDEGVKAASLTNRSMAHAADAQQNRQGRGVVDAQQSDGADSGKPQNREAEFEKLIKGEYKDLYDRRLQYTLRERLKGPTETAKKYEALSPALEILSKKYGVDASDPAALVSAIEEDNSYYEEEASKLGIPVEQLKQLRKMERENGELRRQMQEAKTRDYLAKQYATWMDQAEKLREVYPSFDWDAETKDQRFTDLLRNNIDVRTAYEVLHKDEIIPAAMQFTAKTVEQKLTNKIIAGGARPAENGTDARSAAVTKKDVSKMTREERADIARRALMGERITF